MTTDGIYCYLYIAANNGGMFKIGTGEKQTVPGKIYLYKAITKFEEVSWVYLKGKLYLRSSVKELGTIDIYCTETFNHEGML